MATDPETILDPETPPAADPVAVDPPAADPAVVADPPTGDPPADPPADDWRADMAGDDEAMLKFLGRFHSKAAATKKFKEFHDDIRSGKYRKPLGEDPSEDELSSWRKDFGVPDKPEGYLEKLPEGVVIGDDDRPMVDEYLAAMHKLNAPAEMTAAGLDIYYGLVEKQYAAEAEANDNAKREGEETLLEVWGPDRKRNLNAVQNYLSTLPEDVRDPLLSARDANGVALANNAPLIQWLASLALEANPLATVVPGAGANAGQALTDEMAKLEGMMGNRQSEYWKGPNAEKLQARYRELEDARSKIV